MNRWINGSIAAVAMVGVARGATRRRQQHAIAAFYGSDQVPDRVTVDDREFWLPMTIHRMDGFASLHRASMAAARQLLPSDALHPVSLPGGDAVVMISAFRYWEITDDRPSPTEPAEPPYAEVAATILATLQPRPPLLSLAMMGMGLAPTSGYVPHMAVTHRLARDGGRELWGIQKFIADVDFFDDVATREVRLSEADRHILTLTIRAAGRMRGRTQPSVLYSVLDGNLLEIRMPSVIESRSAIGRGLGRVDIGGDGHPVSETLRRLEVGPEPLAVVDAPAIRTMFVPGVVVGKGRRVVDYEGSDRDAGRFTVRHPGTGPVDQSVAAPSMPAPVAHEVSFSGHASG